MFAKLDPQVSEDIKVPLRDKNIWRKIIGLSTAISIFPDEKGFCLAKRLLCGFFCGARISMNNFSAIRRERKSSPKNRNLN